MLSNSFNDQAPQANPQSPNLTVTGAVSNFNGAEQSNQIKSRSSLLIPVFSAILSVISILEITILDAYMYGARNLQFTPREKFTFDFSYPIQTLSNYWIWIIIILVIGALAAYLISKTTIISRVFLLIFSVAAIAFGILAYYVSVQSCEGLSCIGIGISILFAEATWFIAAGAVPVLAYSSFDKYSESIIKSKIFWLTGLLIFILVGLLWFLTTISLRAEFSKRAQTTQSSVNALYSNKSYPVFEPSYLPSEIGKLSNERVKDISPNVATVGHDWEIKLGGYKEYIRQYLYKGTGSFEIIEYIPNNKIQNGEFYKNDLAMLSSGPIFTNSKAEGLVVNGNQAIYWQEYGVPYLYVYQEGIRIDIHHIARAEGVYISKEELVKIGQSLRKAN